MPKLKLVNAVLVKLNISTFSNSRTDKEITDEVRARKKLGVGAGKWTRYKFPKECLEPITRHAGEVRRWHYDHTTPWEDGARLLNIVGMSKFQERLIEQTKEFFALVDEFGKHWREWLDQAKLMHGPAFDLADYPVNWKSMRECYGINAEYSPMPAPDQFALRGVAESAIKAMQTDLETRVEQRVRLATEDTWTRMLAPVQHMAEILGQNDPRIYETLITNITSICDLVPVLDVEGSSQLQRAARAIREQIQNINVETLRENATFRREVANTATQLVAQFGQPGQRKFAA